MADEADSQDLVDEVVESFSRARPDIDPDTLRTLCRIIVAGRLLEDRAAALLKPSGMIYTDFDILGMLRRTGPPHELTPNDLIRMVMISSGAVTAALGRLEKQGYVARRVSDEDRRVRIVSLTDEGKRVIDEAFTVRMDDAAEAFSGFSEDDHKAIDRLLRDVASRLGQS
ncbi:MarR family transcriptional regulator [Parvularcula sp. ZS-1/3]|uniref:MarR family transcriptional regulator n=1 Tax=Parvularcula mediterranea TaxID=2732508 RepID=A0A7Y3W4Z3_9PROT|nr:MarR family transcriptional regulator [Parvularcula mediterranea]NNU16074.1 MarR family transcriptional regulator [Parvularcula mediterranea]